MRAAYGIPEIKVINTRPFAPTQMVRINFRKSESLSVPAEVYGQWAVHETIGSSTKSAPFNITHMPSGAAVKRDIELVTARDMAQRLADTVPAFTAIIGPADNPWSRAIRAVVGE